MILLLVFSCPTFGQSEYHSAQILTDYIQEINKLDFKKAREKVPSTPFQLKEYLESLSFVLEDDGYTDADSIPKFIREIKVNESNRKEEYILQNVIWGYYLFRYEQNRIEAFSFLRTARQESAEIQNRELEKLSLVLILRLYQKGILQADKEYDFFLDQLEKLATNKYDWLIIYNLTFGLLSQEETYDKDESKNQTKFDRLFRKYDSVFDLSENISPTIHYNYWLNKGNYIIREDPQLAKQYYTEAGNNLGDENNFIEKKKTICFQLYRAERALGNQEKAFQYLRDAKQYFRKADSLRNYFILYTYKADLFHDLKQDDSAFIYERKVKYLGLNLTSQKHNLEISKIKARLDTAEKEKQILEQRTLLTGLIIVIVIGSFVGYLLLKSSRRKRLLALQEKEIETQKNLTLLKEQEISTINAMVEGQEKERKRVAEDLHDNLGSVIATLKLHFENLRINRERKKIDQEQLFDKTENLIDEAYQKVRSIAHAKNAGVIANQGLLFAVKLMAEKISAANTIQIDVIDYGLEKPLENSLEISLFRIIQELTTNIIKHAQANHATINISQDEEDITILIEDNGIGMDTSQIDLQKGMGLHSIKTRVEHLNGTFTIDSTPTKGTTIIIQIPS